VPTGLVVDAESPAGAQVAYTASGEDALDPRPSAACEPASGSVFEVGTTLVSCVATDAAGNEQSASFTVHVEGAAEQLADLGGTVVAAGLAHGLETALVAKLDPNGDACPHVAAFADLVDDAARVGHLPADLAAQLLGDAARIAAVAGC
jgi:HYR domain